MHIFAAMSDLKHILTFAAASRIHTPMQHIIEYRPRDSLRLSACVAMRSAQCLPLPRLISPQSDPGLASTSGSVLTASVHLHFDYYSQHGHDVWFEKWGQLNIVQTKKRLHVLTCHVKASAAPVQ